jgi:hypothetical protein
MIVSGLITKIEIEDNKKVFIEVNLNSVYAICFDGENLIDDDQPYYKNKVHKSGIDENYISNYKDLYKDISSYNITGFIRRHDV